MHLRSLAVNSLLSQTKLAKIERGTLPGLEWTTVVGISHRELHLTLRPLPGEPTNETVARLAQMLREHEAEMVRHEVFGALAVHPETMRALKHEFGGVNWPVMWIDDAGAEGISGMHVFAVSGTAVETVKFEGKPAGRVFSDGHNRHCVLGDVMSSQLAASQAVQCRDVFEKLETVLSRASMGMEDLIRTWFFLDDIISWYGTFNAVRNDFYKQKKVFNRLMPASTGIGARNPAGAALVAGAWAIRPIIGADIIREVSSPLQRSSMEYGSAFSRAVLIEGAGGRRLLVSGTASIEPDGKTAYVDDLGSQIGLTLKVVESLIKAEGFTLSESLRVTVYLKSADGIETFKVLWLEHGWKSIPQVAVMADICRDDLLFEIEVDLICSPKAGLGLT